jgi:hypothetical protein
MSATVNRLQRRAFRTGDNKRIEFDYNVTQIETLATQLPQLPSPQLGEGRVRGLRNREVIS